MKLLFKFAGFVFLFNPSFSKKPELSKNSNSELLPKGIWSGSDKTSEVQYKVAFCSEGNYWFTRGGGVSNRRVRFKAKIENEGVIIRVEEEGNGKWIETLVYNKSQKKLRFWPGQFEGEATESEFIQLRKEKDCPWTWETIF